MGCWIHKVLLLSLVLSSSDFLEALKRVVVFGSTGKTGQQVVWKLQEMSDVCVVCAARDMGKARNIFGSDSSTLSVFPVDIVSDSPSKLASLVRGADAVVCAAGNSKLIFSGAYEVDYRGTVKTIDACIDAGVGKYIMISSLLTNGLLSSQLFNPQYLLLNAAGGVLLWKREAEKYLQKQSGGLKYTIIRPGGLTDKPPDSPLLYGSADTLFGGSLSREQVGKVVAEACFLQEADNKVVEIVATPDADVVSEKRGLAGVAADY